MEELLYRFNPWWTGEYTPPGLERTRYLDTLLSLIDTPDVVFITGLRRVGKTTIMYQLISRLLAATDSKRILYVSLDNIALKDHTILDIVDEYRRIHSIRHRDMVYLFLDEVHSKKDYELQLKNLYDMGHTKIYASGSASLDLIMKSPYLTGRQRLIRINPLNFREFINFRGISLSPEDMHLYPDLAEEYALTGGMPEFVNSGDPNYLQSLVDTIIYRDIAGRHNIRNVDRLKDMIQLIAQSAGTPASLRKISRVTGISKGHVAETIYYFTEANLIHTVEREGKLSERKASPKKYYLADTGLFSVLTENVNLGSVVENLVYLKLRMNHPVRYYRSFDREVDFVWKKRAWESKYTNSIEGNALKLLSSLFGYEKTVITKAVEGTINGITEIPLWKFLLE